MDDKIEAIFNLEGTIDILNIINKGKSISEAFDDKIRSYESALARCLDNGATADSEFLSKFTSAYIHEVLGIISNLVSIKGITKDKDNVEFLKEKTKECLKYMDRL